MQALSQIPAEIIATIIFLVIFFTVAFVMGPKEKKKLDRWNAESLEHGKNFTADDMKAFEDWLDEKALPYTGLVAVDEVPDNPLCSHIGGVAAAPEGASWPVDGDGNPMVLLAQINLAEFTTPSEFPDEGVLQFFIQSDDLFGMDFDDQLASTYKVLFHPNVELLRSIIAPEHNFQKDYAPFNKTDYWQNGRKLVTGNHGPMRPAWDVGFVGKAMDPIYDRPGGEEAMESLFDAFDYESHRIGGHPSFTQEDPRSYGQYSGYDRVLLQIGCDDFIMFGDSGECTFFITQNDLRARRFDRLLFNWDCC